MIVRKTLLFLFLCLLLSSFVLAQGKPAKSTSTGIPDAALMQKLAAGWSSGNPDNVAMYYDKAADHAFYDIAPLKYTGWSQYSAGTKELFATLKSINFTVNDDAAVHRVGNFAYGTATAKTTMTDKAGKATTVDCRWTAIWEKKGANWLIVHEHFSTPMEPAK
jgi:ketosteroid isomerase-like protein